MPHRIVSIDTETQKIAPGLQAPPIACLQWRTLDGFGIIHGQLQRRAAVLELRDYLTGDDEWIITGHAIAFDMVAICANYPELFPDVFAAYESGRIVCTMLREQLLDIAEGTRKAQYNLQMVCMRYPGVPVPNKDDPWRLRYGELLATPLSEWPPEALHYANNDTDTQLQLHFAQERRAAQFPAPNVLGDQCRQAAADFWLKLVSAWGVHTDPAAVERYHQQELDRLNHVKMELEFAGLVRPNGSRDTKRAQALMREVWAEGIASGELTGAVPTTPAGGVSLSEDDINAALAAVPGAQAELLAHYQVYGAAKQVLARIERLQFGDRFPIQPRYNCIQSTGRTSCSQGDPPKGAETIAAYGFQLQNPPRAPGARECFIPRPGWWFALVDYTGMELRTWAFACLKLVGFSRLAEVLNAGRDPHTELACSLAGIPYDEGMTRLHGERGPEAKAHFKGKLRQVSKIGNFGFPGGMGAARFVVQARAEYGVTITEDASRELKQAWLTTWPEAAEYFRFINEQLGGADSYTVQHLLSGRYRGGASYCKAANSYFQGLAADIAKNAGFIIARECYTDRASPLFGCRVWNFAHDEFMSEVPANPFRATAAARRIQSIMEETAKVWMPELTPAIQAVPTLALRWSKAADEKVAESGPYAGCLIPWEWDARTGLPTTE